MLQIIRELKSLNSKNKIPLFIAVDQEGGRVNRSVRRILKVKEKFAASDTTEFNGVDVDIINERIQKIRDKVNI